MQVETMYNTNKIVRKKFQKIDGVMMRIERNRENIKNIIE